MSPSSNEMPVGTANMMIEQALKTFGSVFGRQHRAMKRFLKVMWYINQKVTTGMDADRAADKFYEVAQNLMN